MKKVRLVKCSARFIDRRGFPQKCDNKAVIFPITEHGNLAKKHYCKLHWPKYEKFYDNIIEREVGVPVGQLNKLLTGAAYDPSCKCNYNIHSPASSTEGPGEFTKGISYTSNHAYPEPTLWERIKRTFKKILGG